MNKKQRYIQSFLYAVLFCLILPITPALCAPTSEIQYIQDQEQATLLIPFNSQNNYSAESSDDRLILNFDTPMGKAFANISQQLNMYISNQQISADGKTIELGIKFPYILRTSSSDGILQIDIVKKAVANQDKQFGQKININYGVHDGFERLSFAYEKKPSYAVKSDSDSTIISFLTPAEIDYSQISNAPIFEKMDISTDSHERTDIKIRSKLLKSFDYNNKIILDLYAAPAPASSAASVLQSQGVVSNTDEVINADQSGSENYKKDEVASLAFPWNMEVGVSVFKRGKYIWVAFDHPRNIDLDDLKRQSQKVAEDIIQMPHTKATVLRITPKDNVKVGLRQEGLLWIIDLYTHDIEYNIKEMPIFVQYNSLRQSYLYIPTDSGGNTISVIDPEVGDVILVGTDTQLGVGINEAYQYPDLELLPAKQGFAFIPNSSDIILSKGNTGFSIKADNRGLNISDDLDNLKRQQQSWKDTSQIFNLDIPAQLLKLDFTTAEKQLKEEINQAEPAQKIQAKLQLIRYYLGMGLGSEALKALNTLSAEEQKQIKPETLAALNGVANFLLRRYDEALDDFSDEKLQNNNEAVFWRALTDSALELKKENDIVLLTFISVMNNYPQELQERIALIAVDTAIQSYDDISTQNFIDILKNSKDNDSRRAQIIYLNAKKFEYQGYPNNALKEYNNVQYHQSQKFNSLARFAKANLELKLNLLSPKQAIPELERLRYAWGEQNFKLMLLQKLAEVYEADKNYNKALQTYQESLDFTQDAQEQEKIIEKMTTLFEDLYVNGRADEMSPVKAIALYKDYEWLAPRSRFYTAMAQKLADRMVAVDLLNSASEILKEQLRLVHLNEEQRAQIGARLALIDMFEQDSIAAMEILEQTDSENISDKQKQYRKIIKAKALARLNKTDEALNLLTDDFSKNAILLKSDIYWKAGEWDKAADTIKYLIEKPQEGQALSREQINYILDWITALKKAGKTTVIFRIRNTFLPYFKGTSYYSSFNVLTTNLEANRVDMNAIDKAVDDIAAYSDFSKIYDEALLKQTPVQPEDGNGKQ